MSLLQQLFFKGGGEAEKHPGAEAESGEAARDAEEEEGQVRSGEADAGWRDVGAGGDRQGEDLQLGVLHGH